MENMLFKSKVEPLLHALGLHIKEHRIRLGISQDELAARCGLHRTYISDIERGNRNLSIGAIVLLAEGLGTDLRNFILAIDCDKFPQPEKSEMAFSQSGYHSATPASSTPASSAL